MTREKLLKSPAYWFEYEQNELFRQVSEYMRRENINQTELAAKLNVSKGYISQILNGNFNYTLKKLIELCLAIGLVPQITFTKVEEVVNQDAKLKLGYDAEMMANENVESSKKDAASGYQELEMKQKISTIKRTKKAVK
jgi:transcriptional regulator with XRE-family HTH domain